MQEKMKYLFVFPDRWQEFQFQTDQEAVEYQKKRYPEVKMIVISDESQSILVDYTKKDH